MSAPLDSLQNYSLHVYALRERHSFVTGSTMSLVPVGATLAKLEGRIECAGGLRVEVWELIDFATQRIRSYSYEIYRSDEKVGWYDAWPHPEIPALAPTFPHHKHVSPNLRENRVPASGIRFDSPNLDTVLADLRRAWLSPS